MAGKESVGQEEKDAYFESKIETEMINELKNPLGKHRQKRRTKYSMSLGDLTRRYKGKQWEKRRRPRRGLMKYWERLNHYYDHLCRSLGVEHKKKDYFTGKDKN
jgi:hypothetical protein